MFLGIDLGSSSIKLTLFNAEKGDVISSAAYPQAEMPIDAPQPGFAEQDPEMWWNHFLTAFDKVCSKASVNPASIQAVGISYQMHGLVLVDENQDVLRPSIIWCDSRAVDIGNTAFNDLGQEYCLCHMLNSPGNFTASKLAWVKEHEPEVYSKIHKFMLPGDYIAMRLSKKITTTKSGLSEGIFWDFEEQDISSTLAEYYGIDKKLIAETVDGIGSDLTVDSEIAKQLGLNKDVKITYRAGDQPNNAFSLNVLNTGEVAATAGTSGVIYAVTDKNVYDKKSRINTFLHVNHTNDNPRNGILICINGTGIMYSWLKKLLNTGSANIDYEEMNSMAEQVKPGSEGVMVFPFGNGAERVLENDIIGAHLMNMDFNRHEPKHLIRAGLEGIVYALNIGFEMLGDMNVPSKTIRVGKSNLFLSKTFREIFTNVTATTLELYDTDGAAGAARGAALGAGFYKSEEEAFKSLQRLEVIEPQPELVEKYRQLYEQWKTTLDGFLQQEQIIQAVS